MTSRTNFITALVFLCISGTVASGQGFEKGKIYVGPTLGYVGFGGFGFGLTGEMALDDKWGIGLEVGYTSFSEDVFPGQSFEYTLLSGLASASYHFQPYETFDPFVKVGVGYFNWDFAFIVDGEEENPFEGLSSAYTSGIGVAGQVGAHFHFSDAMAGRVALGYPYVISAGLDFTFGGSGKRATSETGQEDTPRRSTPESGGSDVAADDTKPYGIYIGPYVLAKGGLNTTIPDKRKTGVSFNGVPDMGAHIEIPFGKESAIGFGLDVGYSGISYKNIHDDEDLRNDSTNFTEYYGYINVFPHLNLGGFVLGVSFGFPNSASMEADNGTETSALRNYFGLTLPNGVDFPDYSDSLDVLTEVRIGGMIPLWEHDGGRLNLVLQAGYALSGLYKDHKNYHFAYEEKQVGENEVIEVDKADLNPQPVSASIGLSYLFKIPFR